MTTGLAAAGGVARSGGSEEDGSGTFLPRVASRIELAFFPQQLLRESLGRRLELGLAYQFEALGYRPIAGAPRHGAGLILGFMPISRHWRDEHRLRLGGEVSGEVMFAPDAAGARVGSGVTFSLAVEWTRFMSGAFSGSSTTPSVPPVVDRDGKVIAEGSHAQDVMWVGDAYGEQSVALVLSASQRQLPGESYWLAGAALRFRLPAAAGLWLWFP